ncbi:hypothetical protein Xen7305DRAFT_00024290 [Xenococcus sp. PCC 7305]|uniref:hypothetical protein n=1 Tax=Xenococcus sp. PCC 7305 TaxID=102125 RepID=UPI0002ABD78E|nr:hypothetical protein [Xenococcus sp. PCC 7305]ELS02711.1 hypothetical protein Xen7305DRAFT_00024290 [Xenococcus sp. PCC 7305]
MKNKKLASALHFFGGEKGGVGKSVVCKTVIQLYLDRQIPVVLYDTDRSNPDVIRCYRSEVTSKVAVLSEGERYEDSANEIYNTAILNRVIVNLPAQVLNPLKNWILDNELFEVAAEDGVQLYHWFTSDGGYDSLHLAKNCLKTFQSQMPMIFIRNHGKTDDWSGFEDDSELLELLQQYQVPVIDFPKLPGAAAKNRMDRDSLTFGQVRQNPDFSSIDKQRVRKFLREAYFAFDSLGYFSAPHLAEHLGGKVIAQ